MNTIPQPQLDSEGISRPEPRLVARAVHRQNLLGFLTGICLLPVSLLTAQPSLSFIQPTNNAIFSTGAEIPLVLRAVGSNTIFLSAEVFANNEKIATVLYCCPFCRCWIPTEGETILQFPVPVEDGPPPSRIWQGLTNVQAGRYRMTSQAVSDDATVVDAIPVDITVIDSKLRISVAPDGTVRLVIQQGSLVPGSYDLEASSDLRTWSRLGPFQPGNVAAFYWDVPPENARLHGFYRSVYLPP